MPLCQFQIITGETPANKLLRTILFVGYGLLPLFLICALVPSLHFLMTLVAIVWMLLFVGVLIIELAKIELYQTEGTIKLSETGVILNGLTMQATDLRQVEIKFNFPRGQGAGKNGFGDKGNKIIIHSKSSREATELTVLVEARAQRDNLAALLKEWRKMGIKVSADGIDLV